MGKPLVSFLMTTYGRACLEPRLISEAVHSVLTQDYGGVELVVANDAPGQFVFCHHPKVRCFNFGERFPTWGDKLNAALELCLGDVVCPMDDDDVSLPHRARQAVEMLDGFDYWNPRRWWLSNRGLDADPPLHVAGDHGCGWNCSAYRRGKFRGHYAPSYAEADQRAHEWAHANLHRNDYRPDAAGASYVYRWGVSSQHFSGDADLEHAYRAMRAGPDGVYEIVPRRYTDWPAKVAAKLAATG